MMKRWLAILLIMLVLSPRAQASEPFTVPAKGAVLIDGDSGRILFGQNENEMLPMASTTKIMTALIALENSKLDETVTAGKNAHGVTGTSLYLSEGEELSMEHMLYGLMLRSGNDAAVAIAEHVAGSISDFADLMNARAIELNADAHFINPHGLDADGHKASALGLARIMREAMKIEDFRIITGTSRKVIPWVGNEYSRVLSNKNKLLTTYEGATGGKTGYTGKAGRCLVFSAERDGLSLIGVVLNCYSWFDTAATLLDYGFENFRAEKVMKSGQSAQSVRVNGGDSEMVAVIADRSLSAAVAVNSRTETVIDLPEIIEAPVYAGQILGRAQIKSDGVVIAECNLVAAANVEERSLAQSLRRLFKNWLILLQPQAIHE